MYKQKPTYLLISQVQNVLKEYGNKLINMFCSVFALILTSLIKKRSVHAHNCLKKTKRITFQKMLLRYYNKISMRHFNKALKENIS